MAFTSLSAQDDSARFSAIKGYGFFYKRMGIDSVLYVPLYESAHTPYRAGAIKYRKSDSSFYKYTGTQWLKVQEGGVATNGIDTVYTINDTVQVIETADETYFTIINSPYTEVLNDSTIIVGNDTLIIAGASGGGIWGEITGTLSDQTDLQSALDAKLEAVTTDATLTGDGTAGNPLKVDTLLISTRAWRQKGDDSLGAIIATKLSAVNLDTTRDATSATITNDAGTDAVIQLVDIGSDKAGLMSPVDKGRLDSLYGGLLTDTIHVVSVGDGVNSVYGSSDTIYNKRFHDSTYISWHTLGDSSIVAVLDTAGLRSAIGGSEGTVQGTGTTGTLAYWTDENTIAAGPLYDALIDQLTIDSIRVGQLRVGTGTPGVTDAYPLDVVHNAAAVSIYSTDATNPRLDFRSTNASLNNTADTYASIRGALHSTGGALIGYTAAASGPLVERFRITSAGHVGVGTSSPITLMHITQEDASANSIPTVLTLGHTTTATAGATFGVRIGTLLENGAGVTREPGSVSWNWESATSDAETGQMRWNMRVAGSSTEVMRLVGSNLGIGTTGPDRRLDILDAAAAQLRLTHTDGTVYTDAQTDANGVLTVTPTGRYIMSPTGSTSNYGVHENIIWTSNAVVTATGTSETDLYSNTTRANELGIDGESLEFVMHGSLGNNTGNATIRVYWAGTEVLDVTTTSSDPWAFEVRVTVMRTSSSNARVFARVIGGGFDLSGTTPNPRVTNVTTTFSNTNIIKATGQGSDGGTSIDMFEGVLKWRPTVSFE